jgi:ParB family chromosome partitioning protein
VKQEFTVKEKTQAVKKGIVKAQPKELKKAKAA